MSMGAEPPAGSEASPLPTARRPRTMGGPGRENVVGGIRALRRSTFWWGLGIAALAS